MGARGLDSPAFPFNRGSVPQEKKQYKNNLARVCEKINEITKRKTQGGIDSHGETRKAVSMLHHNYGRQDNVLKTCRQFMIRYVNQYHYRGPPWASCWGEKTVRCHTTKRERRDGRRQIKRLRGIGKEILATEGKNNGIHDIHTHFTHKYAHTHTYIHMHTHICTHMHQKIKVKLMEVRKAFLSTWAYT